jgi:hypothetical protein
MTKSEEKAEGADDSSYCIQRGELRRMEMTVGTHEGGWTGLYLSRSTIVGSIDLYVGRVEAGDINGPTAEMVAQMIASRWNLHGAAEDDT